MLKEYLTIVIWIFIALCLARPARADDWKPIDRADLDMKAPIVEKDADAEGIFWERRVEDKWDGSRDQRVTRNYVRIKIFTDRGKEAYSTIDLEYEPPASIGDISGRTIKPDGSILELKKQDVFDRTLVKAGGIKIKAKSFALPGVEPGAVIEYRWRESNNDQSEFYVKLPVQSSIPYRLVRFSVKPLPLPGIVMRTQSFQGQIPPFLRDSDGFNTTTVENVPAAHEEPDMPPDDSAKFWMLIYYDEDKKLTPEKFWPQFAKEVYEKRKPYIKVNDDVRSAAAKITADASTQEQKLQRLFEFCRSKIKNVNISASGITAEEKAKLKDNKSPSDTLKAGAGTGFDIDMLFVALAAAAGFDARPVSLPNRDRVLFQPGFADGFFLRDYEVAVRVGAQWRFFDPASTYVPFGMLRWQEEGEQALICDPKDPSFVPTPMSGPDKSLTKRVANLTLDEEGTLEGDVTVAYTGHTAVVMKFEGDSDSAAEREKKVIDAVKSRLSTAEVTNVRIENAMDLDKPLVYSYHIKAPGYAQRTGKRLFLQPAFFEHGLPARYTTEERRYPIYFHYPWSEDDDVTVQLPAGYELDHADAPSPFKVGETTEYNVVIQISKDKKTLHYKRSFLFGGKNAILFPAAVYPNLKKIFDALHESDEHTITLKLAAAPAN
jgi:hypothetical protein